MFQQYLLAQLVLFGQKTTDQNMPIKHQIKWIEKQIIINQLIPRSALNRISHRIKQTRQQEYYENSLQNNQIDQSPHFLQHKSSKNQQPIDFEENLPLQILIRQKERQELFEDQFYGMSIQNHINALQFANSRSKSSEPDSSYAVALTEFDPIVLAEILKNKSQDSNEQYYDIPFQQIEQLQMEPV